jgi:hypothetical protein
MALRTRRNLLSRVDARVLGYSGEFLLCALVSALGAGVTGVLAVVALVGTLELMLHRGQGQEQALPHTEDTALEEQQ